MHQRSIRSFHPIISLEKSLIEKSLIDLKARPESRNEMEAL